MIFIEGIAGSGKSKAVFRNVINTINHINPEYLKMLIMYMRLVILHRKRLKT